MGFFKTMLRMNTICLGKASGSGFNGCYVGLAKKDGAPALMIFGTSLKEDYIFNKEDIENAEIVSSGIEKGTSNQMTSVTKYKLTFKDAKTVICSIDQNGKFTSNFDSIVF